MFKKTLLSILVSVLLVMSIVSYASAVGPTVAPPGGLASPTFGGLTIQEGGVTYLNGSVVMGGAGGAGAAIIGLLAGDGAEFNSLSDFGDLIVHGNTTIGTTGVGGVLRNLTVNGTATIGAPGSTANNLTINGTATSTGKITVNSGGLTVTAGGATINAGGLAVTGKLALDGVLQNVHTTPSSINWTTLMSDIITGSEATGNTALANTGKFSVRDDLLLVGDLYSTTGKFVSQSATPGTFTFDGVSSTFQNPVANAKHRMTVGGNIEFTGTSDDFTTDTVGKINNVTRIDSYPGRRLLLYTNRPGYTPFASIGLESTAAVPSSISLNANAVTVGISNETNTITLNGSGTLDGNWDVTGTLSVPMGLTTSSIGTFTVRPNATYRTSITPSTYTISRSPTTTTISSQTITPTGHTHTVSSSSANSSTGQTSSHSHTYNKVATPTGTTSPSITIPAYTFTTATPSWSYTPSVGNLTASCFDGEILISCGLNSYASSVTTSITTTDMVSLQGTTLTPTTNPQYCTVAAHNISIYSTYYWTAYAVCFDPDLAS